MSTSLETTTTSWRVMKAALAFGLLVSALVAAPALICAQSAGTSGGANTTSTGTFRTQLIEVDGRPYNSQRHNEVLGAALCRKTAPLTFRLAGLPAGFNSPEYIWVMVGGSCNASERRDGIGVDDCIEIAQFEREIDEVTKDVTITLSDQVCESGNPQIWFLLTNASPSSETLDQYSAISIPLDTTAPPAGGRSEPGGTCSVPSASRSAWAALPVASALLGLGFRRRARS